MNNNTTKQHLSFAILAQDKLCFGASKAGQRPCVSLRSELSAVLPALPLLPVPAGHLHLALLYIFIALHWLFLEGEDISPTRGPRGVPESS